MSTLTQAPSINASLLSSEDFQWTCVIVIDNVGFFYDLYYFYFKKLVLSLRICGCYRK